MAHDDRGHVLTTGVERTDAFFVIDEEGRFQLVSDAYCDLVGYSRPELLALSVPDLDPDEDQAAFRERSALVARRGSARFSARHRRKDGACVDLDISTIHFAAERRFCVFIRSAAEESRGADSDRLLRVRRLAEDPEATTLRALLDRALDDAIELTQSRIGYIYYYDETLRRFTLHSWSRTVMEQCTIENPPRLYELEKTGIWGEAVRQRQPILVNDFEAYHPLKRGYPAGHAQLRRFLTVPVFQFGRVVAVVGVANKEAEYGDEDVRQLRLFMDSVWTLAGRRQGEELRAKLSAAVEQSPVGVVVFDGEGLVDFVNLRFLERTGLDRPRALGRRSDELCEVFLPAEVLRQAWEQASAGTSWVGEVDRRGPDGALVHEQVRLSPVRDAAGRVTHLSATVEDLTERRRLEAQLLHSRKLESLGTLAGGVAHDFNNILTGLLGLAAEAREELPQGHAVAATLDEMEGLVRRAAALTRGLLAFSRREVPRGEPEDLGAALQGVCQLLRRIIGEDVRLSLELAPGPLPVRLDRAQAEQLLMNLATNARDAMPRGGDLCITCAPVEVSPALAAAHGGSPGRHVRLTVRDTGVGMDEATLARAFDPFFTTKEVGRGTGLGLSIVYGVATRAGGFVALQSAPDQGTRVDLYLPLLAGATTPAPEAGGAGPAPGKGETILLAEDDPAVRDVWCAALRRAGYRVVAAADGQAAVARHAAGGVDLVLLDVTMPGMSGPEALAAMRRHQPGVRALFASGYASERAEAAMPPEARLLKKPITSAELLLAVRSALDQRPAARAG